MRHGLIVKGRRYYSPKLDEYVIAVERGSSFATFRRKGGDVVRLKPRNVFYVSIDDYNLCDDLATAAKMTWFFPWFDDLTGTEVNLEEADEHTARSYRMAIKDLSEGLVDQNFLDMPNPEESFTRFWDIVRGMGLYDAHANCMHIEA